MQRVFCLLCLLVTATSGIAKDGGFPDINPIIERLLGKQSTLSKTEIQEKRLELSKIPNKKERQLLLKFFDLMADESKSLPPNKDIVSLASQIGALPHADISVKKEMLHLALELYGSLDLQDQEHFDETLKTQLANLTTQVPSDPDLYSYQAYLLDAYSSASIDQVEAALQKCMKLSPSHSMCRKALETMNNLRKGRRCVGSGVRPDIELTLGAANANQTSSPSEFTSLYLGKLARGVRETNNQGVLDFQLTASGIRSIKRVLPKEPKTPIQITIRTKNRLISGAISVTEILRDGRGELRGVPFEDLCAAAESK